MSEIEKNEHAHKLEKNNKIGKESNKKDDLEVFRKSFFTCFEPILGTCAHTGRPVITYFLDGLQSTRYLDKEEFQHLIMKMLFETGHRGDHVLNLSEKFVKILKGEAIASGRKIKLDRRIGRLDDKIYINLSNETGEFLELTQDGKKLIKKSPIHFLGSPKDLSLPHPLDCSPKEFLELWNSLFNFKDKNSSYLALVNTVKSMIPNSGANPILVIEGVQGAGKTTSSMIFKKLIDPTQPAVFSPPKNEKDFLVMGIATYLMVIDNSSGFSAEMSDVLCRASTGGGISLRVLYETDDERIYNLCKPIIVNGIEELTDRADFVERALILHLQPLTRDTRISEMHFWDNFNQIYPKLFGGLTGLVSTVLKNLPTIQTTNLVRMTEFNRVGLALDKAFEFPEGHFSKMILEHHDQKLKTIFDNDFFCQLISEALKKESFLEGSASQLMKKIYKGKTDNVPGHILPKDPRRFKGKLQRLKPVLLANGIEWDETERTSSCRGLYIKLLDDSNESQI